MTMNNSRRNGRKYLNVLPDELRNSILSMAVYSRSGERGHGISRNLTQINQPRVGTTIRIRNLSKNNNPGRLFDFEAVVNISKKAAIAATNRSHFIRSQTKFNSGTGNALNLNNNNSPNELMLARGQMAGKQRGNKQWYLVYPRLHGTSMPVFISYPSRDPNSETV